ncbi:MAG: response regulator [Cellvibrionaceae bacterium]
MSKTSIRHNLLFWFLAISLVPLSLLSWFFYQQASENLAQSALDKLEQEATLKLRFINNWFDYRLMDLSAQSESQANSRVLEKLSADFKASGQSVSDYVKSYPWVELTQEITGDFHVLQSHYDYIYDIFLIDNEGNLLFSVEEESDLGTNLLTGIYANTDFGVVVRRSLETGETLFSGVERYGPSDGEFAGFLVSPLLNDLGDRIGVFAVQLRLDRIFNILGVKSDSLEGENHYVVARGGYLLSPVDDNWDDVLRRKIDLQSVFNSESRGEGSLKEYVGAAGNEVFGTWREVSVLNQKGYLFSEIDKKVVLSSADLLAKIMAVMFILTLFFVAIMAVAISRRITHPIVSLVGIAKRVASGDIHQRVDIESEDELGDLAVSFNEMLESRELFEQSLKSKNEHINKILLELEDQKFALDQHSIVAITDIKGTITFVNDKFCEISGYARDELVGANHRIVNSGCHDLGFFREMYKTISSGKVWHGDICNRAKDKHLYWVGTTIVPFMGDDGKPKSYISIRTDITETRRASEELIKAKDDALMAVKAKSEFLASMSHEIRTPMNGVIGMLNLLLNTPLDSDQQRRVKVAQSSARSLLTLINDILDFSKVEAGKLDLEEVDFDLRSMMGEFGESMGHLAQEKHLELIIDTTEVDASMVCGDPGRLRQILTNIVGNAIKFTEQGEILIQARLESESDSHWRLCCDVIDTGIGIPPDKLEHLFDSFSQVDASTTRKFGGTGLGLAIVKQLCQLMKGDVSVTSALNEGSCFSFNIALKKSVRYQKVIPKVDISSLSILVVDDNATNREVLCGQLEHWGASVTEASRGQEALDICHDRLAKGESIFDIGLLDMQMPEMSGADLGRALKADETLKAIRLVMMTSMGGKEDIEFFSSLGFDGYFPKPATTSDLFDALSLMAVRDKDERAAEMLTSHHLLGYKREDGEVNFTEAGWPEGTRILLVEDNFINQEVAVGILEDFGLYADIAGNGIEALAALKNAPKDAPFSLILMDCQMPDMDGYEASQAIRSGEAGVAYQSIPIVALTANAMTEDREKCLNAGMSDYLSKPVDDRKLQEKLRFWLIEHTKMVSEQERARLLGITGVEPQGGHLEGQQTAPKNIWLQDEALERVRGKTDRLRKLVVLFLGNIDQWQSELEQAVADKDYKQLTLVAHSVKGVAANLSVPQLQQASGTLELAAREESGDFDSMLVSWREALAEFIPLAEAFVR